jgi:hypothetical protein
VVKETQFMPGHTITESELIARTIHLIEAGDQVGISLRLLGGLAVRLAAPSASQHSALHRVYADIDFVGLSSQVSRIRELFRSQSYQPDGRFNALHGHTRLIFYEPTCEKHIDVFLDQFKMCHVLDLRNRLLARYCTLPLADLLITKLQIIQLNSKDLQDILAILLDCPVESGERPGVIDDAYIAGLTGRDWGLYTTLCDNLERVQMDASQFLSGEELHTVQARCVDLLAKMQAVGKTFRWRLRSKVGRRMEWYDLPDEVAR